MAADTNTANITVANNVYTEAQHFALLESAVERETATLAADKEQLGAQVAAVQTEKAELETKLSEAQARVDVLEAEKASAEAATAATAKEFEDYKAELARAEQIAARKTERVERVKAANANLASTFFTDERAARWAEMADEQFDSLVADMTEAAAAVIVPAAAEGVTDATEQARESAAFTGGETAKSTEGSAFGQFLIARGMAPAPIK